jgi:vacuolar iron transporter family protein
MKAQIKAGLSFGLTSGVITTLGLIIGLYYSTQSKIAVLGGILIIAFADALSDAMGMHLAKESESSKHNEAIIIAIVTFASKLIIALTFIVPVLILSLQTAVYASIIWGLLLLTILSYAIAKSHKEKPWKTITEHLVIAIIVIIISFYIGKFVGIYF